MTDDGLAQLAKFSRLQTLILDGTQVTDAGLTHLRELTTLWRLDVKGTQVTYAGAAELRSILPNLTIEHSPP